MNYPPLAKDFAKFIFVGTIWSVIAILLTSLFIDWWGFSGLAGSTLVVGIAFFGRYFHYLLIKMIRPNFIKYTITMSIFSLFTIGGMSLLVDMLNLSGFFSAIIVVGGLSILKFFTFEKVGLLRK